MKNDFLYTILSIILLSFLIIPILVWHNIASETRCREMWKESGYHYKYSGSSGCLVSKDGVVFIPSTAIREFTNKGELK